MRVSWIMALTLAGCAATTTAGSESDTGSEPPSCDVTATATALVGPMATSCGLAPADDPAGAAWSCAVDAFEAGDPFWMGWEVWGTDTLLVYAMVSNGARVVLLAQDHEDEPPWRIDGSDCVDPYVGAVGAHSGVGATEILCTSRQPEGNHYQVCGTCPGCGPDAPVPFVWP